MVDAKARVQASFREMLKNQIAPALREMGFKGSGQAYRLDVPDHWAMIGFQRSYWAAPDEISFTINVLVFSKADWDQRREQRPHLPEQPNPNRYYAPNVLWQHRIGHLLPPKPRDVWWQLKDGEPTEAVAHEVIAGVRDHVLPAIRQQTAP